MRSGLKEAVSILSEIDDIHVHRFNERDVVRHRLVREIILAYDKHDREKAANKENDSPKRFKLSDAEKK